MILYQFYVYYDMKMYHNIVMYTERNTSFKQVLKGGIKDISHVIENYFLKQDKSSLTITLITHIFKMVNV